MTRPLGSGKNLIKLLLLAWICGTGVVGVAASARWFGNISRSQETNEIFNAAATLPPELLEAVVWQPDSPGLKREIDPLTRVDVTSSWIRAWEQLSIVAQTGDTTGLDVYFANSALEGLAASKEESTGQPVYQLGHNLRIDFHSRDGQVVGLTADEVRLIRSFEIGGTLGWMQTVESYQAVLVLEGGTWRIHHWVRRESEHRWWTDRPPDGRRSLIEVETPGGQPDDPRRAAAAAPPSTELALNGVNYYPRDAPFDDFWPNYEPDIVAGDLDLIVAAGLDSIRVFLPFDELGGRWTTSKDLAPVIDLMNKAEERGLGVVITLFDGRTDHRPAKWDSDSKHIATVVAALANHPALLMWDLKNEPDRDIGANGVEDQLLYAWLGHVAHELRKFDPDTPTTVGWSTPDAALAAPIHTDVVSFHFYGPAASLPDLARALVRYAGGRPVVLSEYGLPSWNSVFPGGHTEAEQAEYLADVIDYAEQNQLTGAMVWTLWDLAAAPPDAGLAPWKTGPQTNLGLLRADGTAKPALAVVNPQFDHATMPAIRPAQRLSLLFWRLVAISTAGLLVLWRLSSTLGLRRRAEKTKPRQRNLPSCPTRLPSLPNLSKSIEIQSERTADRSRR